MITFEKINNMQAFILYNKKRIGLLEKTIGGYRVELEYKEHFLPEALKPRLKKHINTIYGYSQGYVSLGKLLKR